MEDYTEFGEIWTDVVSVFAFGALEAEIGM